MRIERGEKSKMTSIWYLEHVLYSRCCLKISYLFGLKFDWESNRCVRISCHTLSIRIFLVFLVPFVSYVLSLLLWLSWLYLQHRVLSSFPPLLNVDLWIFARDKNERKKTEHREKKGKKRTNYFVSPPVELNKMFPRWYIT